MQRTDPLLETRAALQLRPAWTQIFRNALTLAVFLVIVLVVLRLAGTLDPRELRWTLPLGFLIMMAIPWIVLMFLTALVFARLRRNGTSLYPAMIAHAAFNAAMNTWIFAVLW